MHFSLAGIRGHARTLLYKSTCVFLSVLLASALVPVTAFAESSTSTDPDASENTQIVLLDSGSSTLTIDAYGGQRISQVGTMEATGSSGEHENFAASADDLFAELGEYLHDQGLEDQLKAGKVKFWLTGYSRGAAVANLTAKRLVDAYQESGCEVFAYTNATPQGAVDNSSAYDCIHSTVSTDDIVPQVIPSIWDGRRYGVDNILSPQDLGYDDIRSSLKAVDANASYAPESFKLCKVNSITTDLLAQMATDPGNIANLITSDVTSNASIRNYYQAVISQLCSWCGLTRQGYVTPRTVDSTTYPSAQDAIKNFLLVYMALSSSELSAIMSSFMSNFKANLLSTSGGVEYSSSDLYTYGVLGYCDLPTTVKHSFLITWTETFTKSGVLNSMWALLGDKSTSGTAACILKNKAAAQGISWADFKKDFYSLMDVVLTFTSKNTDYERPILLDNAAPTCVPTTYTMTTRGWEFGRATACATYSITINPGSSHSWGQWVIDTNATMTDEGSRHHACSQCGTSESDTLAALSTFMKGDVNANGKVNFVDAQIVFDMSCGIWDGDSQYSVLLDILPSNFYPEALKHVADFNGEGVVEASDARAIQASLHR